MKRATFTCAQCGRKSLPTDTLPTDMYVQHNRYGYPHLVKGVGELAFCSGSCMADYVSAAIVRHRDALADEKERDARCEICEGSGVVSFNPNLNPNNHPAMATAKCARCDGTGKDGEA